MNISVAKNFTTTPGARTYADGPFSGQEFFEAQLLPSFEKAVEEGVVLDVDLDGTDGYASSFLNEAFRLLSKKYGSEFTWKNLNIISTEVPKYAEKVKEAIFENE